MRSIGANSGNGTAVSNPSAVPSAGEIADRTARRHYLTDPHDGRHGPEPHWRPVLGGPTLPQKPPSDSNIDWHPAFRRLIAALPFDIRESLSPSQLAALSTASRPQPSPHLVALRVSIPLPWRRIYLAFFLGRENRSLSRLHREGQTRARLVGFAVGVGLCAVIGAALIGAGVMLYLLKSAAGIDLLEGPSLMHGLL